MKTRQILFTLGGIIALVVGIAIGRYLQPSRPRSAPSCNPGDVCIAISDSGGKCEATYPVAVLHYGSNGRVQWTSPPGKQYWISFLQVGTVPNYCAPPDSPLANDPLPADGTLYHVKPKDKYYCYAIFDHNPTGPSGPCKGASDERDTGLNIKR